MRDQVRHGCEMIAEAVSRELSYSELEQIGRLLAEIKEIAGVKEEEWGGGVIW